MLFYIDVDWAYDTAELAIDTSDMVNITAVVQSRGTGGGGSDEVRLSSTNRDDLVAALVRYCDGDTEQANDIAGWIAFDEDES